MIAAEIYVLKIDIIDGKDVSVPVKLEKPALIHISAGFLFGTGTDTDSSKFLYAACYMIDIIIF